MVESEEPTQAEIKDEESGADDPALQQLDKEEPEVDDTDDDVSDETDETGDELPAEEEYDPANDGDDAILKEVVEEEATNA
jgi:hypothetical protein